MLTTDTITVGSTTYELVDAAAREDIEALKEAVADNELFTMSGTFLKINNSAKGGKINKVVVYGTLDPITELGINITGRNLLHAPGFSEATKNGIVCTKNDDGSYTFVGTSTADIAFGMSPAKEFVIPPGTYYGGMNMQARDWSTNDGFMTIWGGPGLANSSISPSIHWYTGYTYVSFSNGGTYNQTWFPYVSAERLTEFREFCGGTTNVDLQGNTIAALEDGTCDELVIDKNGSVVLFKRTDGDERTVSLGTVSIPTMPEDENRIWANSTKTPTIEVTYGLPSAEGPVVLYTEQTLTESQQEQVRKNIGIDSLGATINYADYYMPTLYLTGDMAGISKDNAVTLNYVYGSMAGTCTVKWQGSSSLYYHKKNFTIKFDQAFEAADGWGAEKKYCFKANFIDHSHARNVVSAKLWGQVVKSRATVPERLAALPNAGAVDGFPCIIMYNGEFYGFYTFNIPKDGWMFGMSDETATEAIVCANEHSVATSFKAAALLDESDFELEYVADENNADWVLTSLNRLIQACIDSDGTDLDTTVAQYLDWDSAIDYYIFTCMIRGGDNTDKNYLLATFDGVKWYFSGYDMDSTYGLQVDGKAFLPADSGVMPDGYAAMHRVMELIKRYKLDSLKARYAELRAGVLSEDNVARAFANFAAGIPSPLLMDDVRRWPFIPNTSGNNTAQIVSWYSRRVKAVDAAIEAL